MIRIESDIDQIVIRPTSRSAEQVINRPLHRIFLGGTLGAEPSDEGIWVLHKSRTVGKHLESLSAHFSKYAIDFQYDSSCRDIVESIERRREHFRKKLRSAREIKDKGRGLSTKEQQLVDGALVRELTTYQEGALKHLLEIENGANFSVPGSGKTAVVVAYFELLRQAGAANGLLVLGPVSSFRPWEQEFERCTGRSPVSARLAGLSRVKRQELYLTGAQYELLLTSYQTAARDESSLVELLRRRKTLLVLDESHYVKRPVGGQLADSVLRLAPYAARRVILTGTPMPNGLADVWSQITFLWPEDLPLGGADTYLARLRRNDEESVFEEVKERLYPLYYRVSKQDLDLPTPSFKVIYCVLRPAQQRIYRGVAARFLSQTDEAPADQEALAEWRRARTVRLLQIASNPSLLRRAAQDFRMPPLKLNNEGLKLLIERYSEFELPVKIERACTIARELARAKRKVLIWSTFVHNLEMLKNKLRELDPAMIHGRVPYGAAETEELTREQEIERFRRDPRCQVLIANPAACAEAISLHDVCHDAIYLDRSFNCAQYLQSLDRIHRLGLAADATTTYYLLLAKSTVDEIVNARLQTKMDRLHELVERDLPTRVPGYWGEELDEEAFEDFQLVEQHIRGIGSRTE